MSDTSSGGENGKWGAIIVGLVMAVPLTAILANQAPMVLLTVVVVGFLAWAGVRSGVLADDDEETTADVDPLVTLQERYAAGDLSEAEFERRLERILESDEAAKRAGEGEAMRAGRTRSGREPRERERGTERE